MPFHSKIDRVGQEWHVTLSGDLDIKSSPEMKNLVFKEWERNPGNLVFNLEQLQYLDSTGLGAFISLYKAAKERNFSIRICHARPNVKKLFTITELDQVFAMED